MNIFNEIINAFEVFISNSFLLEKENNNFSYDFNVEERRKNFGDFSSNATLILCKLLQKSPKEIFEIINKNFKNDDIEKLEFAGARFINFYIKDDVYSNYLKKLIENKIIEAVEILKKNNAIYETEDAAIWFKATEYGDEKDRVLKRSNGSWTYVAADIAYLKNKI